MKLIKFGKKDCSPCTQLSNILRKELPKYEVELVEIDAEHSAELVSKYNVTTLPMLFVEDDYGNVIASKRGVTYTPRFLADNLVQRDLHKE